MCIFGRFCICVCAFLRAHSYCCRHNRYLIWDNSTRAELTDYVEHQQSTVIKTGEQDPDCGANFVFSAHKDEVKVRSAFPGAWLVACCIDVVAAG